MDPAKRRKALFIAAWLVYKQWEKDWVAELRKADEDLGWRGWYEKMMANNSPMGCYWLESVYDSYMFSSRSGSWPSSIKAEFEVSRILDASTKCIAEDVDQHISDSDS